MKYLSLDIETTGLDPDICDILEIGAYVEDTDNILPREKLPCYHRYINKEIYRGDPFALHMNAHIFGKLLEAKGTSKAVTIYDVEAEFKYFLDKNFEKRVVVAGKNVAGFDLPFLSKLPNWKNGIKLSHRVIDVGMLFFDPRLDTVPPDLKLCKQRAGLPEHVSHEALDDAWDVIQLMRVKYNLTPKNDI